MRDYKDALVYADSCLQLNNQLIDYNSNDDFNGSISASYPFKQFNKETIFYTEMNLEFSSLVLTISKPKIDTSLYNAYDTTDLRKQAYFSPGSNGYPAFKGSYAGSYYLFTGIATDEMYLTRAECLIRVGNIQQGLDDLNTLLAKRYKTGTYTAAFGISKDSALTLVLNERRKELVQRGLRWMDIKRLNKENAAIIIKRVINGKQYTLQPNTAFYALPIPDDIIKLNNMEQN
ncbi:hypothetical protein A9P82_08310 [Arachidicoccus ginsenosidimutans]|nr:hypothetical protein A9P82_08310 [Arachidicoccus sp. BS20]